MTNICGGCGRMIEKQFIYCPWCGAMQIKKTGSEYQKLRCRQAEEKRRAGQEKQLQTVENQLAALEKELDVLILSAVLAQ